MKIRIKKVLKTINKNHICRLCLLVVFICVAIISISADIGLFKLPIQILQRTGDEKIFQTLYSAQAALVGIVIAIISMLAFIIDSKIYGMSLIRFVMIYQHKFPLKHNIIVIEILFITALSWFVVALRFNNFAIALFVISIFFLSSLAIDALKIMNSKSNIQNEIRDFIIDKNELEYITDLFYEIKKSILSGDSVSFHRDIDFANMLIKKNFEKIVNQNAEILKSLLSTLIRTANNVQFLYSSEVIDLLITTIETANSTEDSTIDFRDMDTIVAYELLGKTTIRSLVGVSGKDLLLRWHQEFLINNAKVSDDSDIYNITVAPHIYQALLQYPQEEKERLLIELLNDSHSFLTKDNIPKNAAEENYIALVLKLMKDRQESLIEGLFGVDGHNLNNLINQISNKDDNFELIRANIFIVMYIYYLAYYESNDIVDEQEKHFCSKLLNEVWGAFWTSLLNYNISKLQADKIISEYYLWFNDKLMKYERSAEKQMSTKTMIYEHVVLDLFLFGVTHLYASLDSIKCIMKQLINKRSVGDNKFTSMIMNRYVNGNMYNEYNEFCSISNDYHNSKEEYNLLKEAITDCCRDV